MIPEWIAFFCREPKTEGLIRTARRLYPLPSKVVPLWDRIIKWNPEVDPAGIGEFYNPLKVFYTVDDVGLVWCTLHPGTDEVEGHFIFWDGRLRGRQSLIRGLCGLAMDIAQVDKLAIYIPRKEKMILAFLFRCGFSMEYEQEGVCKVYILRG